MMAATPAPTIADVAIVGYRLVPPDQLLAHPLNARRHPAAQREALRASLRALGWIAPVVVNLTTGHVIDGHARVEEALSADVPAVPVVEVELSPEQEALALASFDPITAMAAYDREALDVLLREVDTGEAALQALLADVAKGAGLEYGTPELVDVPPQLDRAGELQQQWGTALGQLWSIPSATVPGQAHRLLCGDSTDAATVARLMDGRRAALLVTSPPYNQHIDQFAPSGMHKEADWVPKVARLAYADSLPEAEYQAQQRCALTVWDGVLVDGASVFYNHKNRYRDKAVVSPLEWLPGPFRLRQEIVWARPGSVTQNARMFLPSDERIYWLYKGDDFYFDDSTAVKSYTTVWAIGLETNKDHAVGFPVELPTRCLRACSRPGALVLEPYAGSGTTLVAAEALGRIVYGLELAPAFLAVALQRLADLGLRPERSDG